MRRTSLGVFRTKDRAQGLFVRQNRDARETAPRLLRLHIPWPATLKGAAAKASLGQNALRVLQVERSRTKRNAAPLRPEI
jgi:hypothetical protein